jgi:autotransporter adhesin
VALGAYAIADRPNTVSVGASGQEREVVNVAPATLGTDAVNLNQLQAVERKMASGVASALAMAPAQIAPGKTVAVGVGLGQFAGSAAIAINISHLIKDNMSVNAGVSYSSYGVNTTSGNNSQVGARVAMSYSF